MWSEDIESLLIAYVKEKRAIWDVNDPEYKSTIEKGCYVEDIAKNLGKKHSTCFL